MKKYSIGLDFGTNSCRALIVDIADGNEIASHIFAYPSGEAGVIIDPGDPNLARQNPADYFKGNRSNGYRIDKESKIFRLTVFTGEYYWYRSRYNRKQSASG